VQGTKTLGELDHPLHSLFLAQAADSGHVIHGYNFSP
jgi:hypothetical protein